MPARACDSLVAAYVMPWLCAASVTGMCQTMQSFRPLTVERAKVLLPLVGVPLVEYTLEWLVSSGITEVRSKHIVGCQQPARFFSYQQTPACRLWCSAAHMRSRCSST